MLRTPCFALRLSHLFLLLGLLFCGLSLPVLAATKTFDSTVPAAMRLIDVSDTTYEGYDIIVSGVTVTINGAHSFASLRVQSGGNVTHASGLEAGMNLTITGNVTITLGSYISVDGAGYPSATGPGKGANDTSGNSGGGGASYGGEGQYSSGAIYGDVKNPTVLGSGGGVGYNGTYGGGSGGGRISLKVNGTLQIDGRLTANGGGANFAGAGSGGSILLNVNTLSGVGFISAYGGYANRTSGGNSGGGGGGGRIAIYYATNNFAGGISAGGGGSYDRGIAGAGTIFLQNPSQTQGDLWVQNDGNSGAGTTLLTPYTFDNVKVWNRGALTPPVLGTLDVTVLGVCNILSGGSITAGGRGFGGGQGPGAGGKDFSGNSGGGGASYGGEGQYSSGAIYGDVKNPVDLGNGENLGSGGGAGYANSYGGGSGGGAIRLTVNGTLQVDGDLSVNGGGANFAGAGSGGSLLLRVGLLSGAGTITAYGGYANRTSGGNSGGGGGGGRIAIYYATNNFAGGISAGGGGSYDRGIAGAGTIFLQNPSQTQGDLWVQNDGNSGAGTTLLTPYTFDNVKVWNRGALTPPVLGTLDVTVLGVCNILSGGSITAGGRGFGGGKGPGAGSSDTSGSYGGGGGGYGGKGTNAYNPGGGVYGSQTLPVDFGSGGGAGYANSYGGGSGGGAIRLTVNGTLQVDGDLSVNGGGANFAGAGSGGSLLLRVGLLSGAGTITAYGGYANRTSGGNSGGGGGGGRIAIYYATNNFASPGVISVAGGGSYDRGTAASGTLFTQQTVGNLTIALAVNPTTLGGGQTAVGNVTLSGPAPTGGINIALASSDTSAATVPSSVTIAEGATSGVFTITANSVKTVKTAQISAQLYNQIQSVPVTVQPWLGSLQMSPTSATGGESVTGTLSLNLPAPASGLTVTLASSDPAVTLPNGGTLTFAGGTAAQNFTLNIGNVTAAKTAAITVTYLAESLSKTLYLNPAGTQVLSVTAAPASIVGGLPANGVLTLTGPAPTGGLLVALVSADTATATVPASVLVPAGQTSASFTIATNPVAATKSVQINATLGVTKITTLTVRQPGVASLTLLPASVGGGDNAVGVVTLDAPATAPTTVTLSSSASQAVPTANIVIPVGQSSGSFTIATSAVSASVTALITARANGIARSQGLTITPKGATISGSIGLDSSVNLAQSVTFVFRPTAGGTPLTYTTTLGTDGSFVLPGLPPAKYNLWVKGAKWLAQVVSVDATGGNVSGITATLPGGDADNNNTVDVLDFGVLVNAYGTDSKVTGSGYDNHADFNDDGVVDVLDFGILVNNYGAIGAP